MDTDPKRVLQRYLRVAREALVWKLEGLSDYDIRRPLTGTGTNLLGTVKHLACVELGYFGDTFDRAHGETLPGPDAPPNVDMYALATESRSDIMAFYERAAAHTDQTIAALSLDHRGRVPWWPDDVAEVSLHFVLVHMISETNRHLGQVDILREQLDGRVGMRSDVLNLPDADDAFWPDYLARVNAEANAFLGP